MWGLIDLHCDKEKLFESLANPALFVQFYNEVAEPNIGFEPIAVAITHSDPIMSA